MPDDPNPPGDRRSGRGDGRGDDAGALLPRRRERREPQRARHRRALAVARRAARARRGGCRGDRLLWQGGEQTLRGEHYTVEHARIYTLPDEPPDIYVAGAAPRAAELAGRIGDGFVSTAPEEKFVDAFEAAGGDGKPKIGMMHCASDSDERAGLERAARLWSNLALKGPLGQDLATPSDFEAAAQMVDQDDVAELVACGPDPEPYLDAIRAYDDAGFTHVYVHQIGENQDDFAAFARRELMPKL